VPTSTALIQLTVDLARVHLVRALAQFTSLAERLRRLQATRAHVELPFQGSCLLRVVRVRVDLVPFEELRSAENRVRGDVQVEVFFNCPGGDVSVKPCHLTNQLYFLLG